MTLYEMSAAARELYALLEAEEIDEQTLRDTLEAMGADDKLLAYIHVQKQLEAEYAAFESEAERIDARMDALRERIKRLHAATTDFLQASGQKKVKAGTFDISLRTFQHVEIDDPDKIPAEFLRTKPAETHPDKKAIMQALRNGEAVDGVHIEQTCSAVVR